MLLLLIAVVQLVLGGALLIPTVIHQVAHWSQFEYATLTFVSHCLLVSGGGALLASFLFR